MYAWVMTETMRQMQEEITEAMAIDAIVAPWLPVNMEREPWTVTLRTGAQITICCPVGAAADVERAGHQIVAA